MISMSRRMAVCLAVLLSLLVAGQAMAITWGTLRKVADASVTIGSFNQAVAMTGTTAHALYNTESGSVRIRRSADFGATWLAAVTLQSASATTLYNAVSIGGDGSLVVAAYTGVNADNHTTTLYVRRSEDGGVTWKARQAIATWTGEFPTQHAAVDVVGQLVVMAWTSPTNGAVYVRRSTDGAKTLLARQSLGTSTFDPFGFGPDGLTAVAIAGARVYVTWIPSAIEGDVYGSALVARRSGDSGQTFSARQNVDTRDIDPFNSPSVDADGTTVLVHYQLLDGRIVVARSTDGGVAYAKTTLATPTDLLFYLPGDVFIGPNGLARTVYIRLSDVDDRVLIRSSANGGQTWSSATTAIGAAPVYKLEAAVLANTTHTLVATEAFPDTEPFLPQIHARRGTN
jgi:hypothetical protein